MSNRLQYKIAKRVKESVSDVEWTPKLKIQLGVTIFGLLVSVIGMGVIREAETRKYFYGIFALIVGYWLPGPLLKK